MTRRRRRSWVLVVMFCCLRLGPALSWAASPESGEPRAQMASEGYEFASRLLDESIRICEGTPWPEPTDQKFQPLLEANRDRFQGKRVLDIGTGSGILALYAARSGAAKVVATDIEPRAVDCVRANALRLGLQTRIDARLVGPDDPSAYSVIGPAERFDIILAFPPGFVNRIPSVVSGALDEGITPNDNIRLGLSIVRGLEEHLTDDGVAVLCYVYAVSHTLLVGYARHLGYCVVDHPAEFIDATDWYALYNTFAAGVALTERIDPQALLLPRRELPTPDPSAPPDAAEQPSDEQTCIRIERSASATCPPLWGEQDPLAVPGVIVIRKPPANGEKKPATTDEMQETQ